MTTPMTLEQRQVRLAGPLTDSTLLPRVLVQLIKLGLPVYLDEAARQDGDPGKVQRPRSYQTHPARATDLLAEQSLPRVVVVDGGTTGEPFGPDGNGMIGHQWNVGIAVTVAGKDESDALLKAGSYGAALRGLILHHAHEFHSQIAAVTWNDSLPGSGSALVDKEQRSIAVVEEQFTFRIVGIVNTDSQGLVLPDHPEGYDDVDMGDQPLIEHTDLSLSTTLEVD
jgi:hypothetical protein